MMKQASYLFTALLVQALFLVEPTLGQDLEPVGRIISVQGDVEARGGENGVRALSRRASIYEGETIVTGPGATAQLRMVDSALIAISESSEFVILEYQYEENPSSDSSVVELVEGGFRTITGAIADQNRERYNASIRGLLQLVFGVPITR